MNCYAITVEPKGETYIALVEFCCSLSSMMTLVVREPHPEIDLLLERLSSDLVKQEETSEWPGTKLLYGGRATLYSYAISPRLLENLKDLAAALYDWTGYRPEDPCFFRADSSSLLATTSHEHDACFLLADQESGALRQHYPALAEILSDEGALS